MTITETGRRCEHELGVSVEHDAAPDGTVRGGGPAGSSRSDAIDRS